MTSARQLGLSVLACLAGAGLSIYAATRVWSVDVTVRPGLSELRATTTGAAREPWVVGLALVALAGAGALLATRGTPRRVLGGLLTLAGAAVAVGAILGRAGLDPGAAGAGGTFWPVAAAVGGAIIAVGGLAAARHGHRWPTMSSRYERRPVQPAETDLAATAAPLATAGPKRGETLEQNPTPIDTRAAWDALDRGDDPTMR
jgi:uncharacterized membrane protein (TIGR02234 family)